MIGKQIVWKIFISLKNYCLWLFLFPHHIPWKCLRRFQSSCHCALRKKQQNMKRENSNFILKVISHCWSAFYLISSFPLMLCYAHNNFLWPKSKCDEVIGNTFRKDFSNVLSVKHISHSSNAHALQKILLAHSKNTSHSK